MNSPDVTALMRTVVVVATVSMAGCGLIDAGLFDGNSGAGITCANGECTCDEPQADNGEVCTGVGCSCTDGALSCDGRTDDCEVFNNTGACFNGFCDCNTNTDNNPFGCACNDTPGVCTSSGSDNIIIVDDKVGCSGECQCVPDAGEGCRCDANTPNCLMNVNGVVCTDDALCGALSRSRKTGCDPALPAPANRCRGTEVCLVFDGGGIAQTGCFIVQSDPCPPGFSVATVTARDGNAVVVCLTDALNPATCVDSICVDRPPG